MTLQERLERARQDRLRAAGISVDEVDAPDDARTEAPEPLPAGPLPTWTDAPRLAPPPPPPPPLRAVPTLDLSDDTPVVDLRSSAPSFSSQLDVSTHADHCPVCGGEPQLDMQDVVGGVDHYSCTNCGHLFQVAR